ncbi:MAG TPA: hypothetical protein ENK90_03190, partial [Epsilonproteobacteria bacterium]|nr:hypothetical protein [Campylobacterota bacterium]
MMKEIIYLAGLVILTGCGSSNSSDNSSGNTHALSQPFTVYNQAYQENFQADSIDEIETNAHDAYVLLDTFGDNVVEYIHAIKQNNNQIGGYISAGTGENYRDDFAALEPYLTPTSWTEWPDEFFVSETTTGILPIMKKRIDKMAISGVDWVEFDNMDWLDEDTRVQYN